MVSAPKGYHFHSIGRQRGYPWRLEKEYITMSKLCRVLSMLIAALLLFPVVHINAESASSLTVNINEAAEVPQTIPYYKMERIQLDSDKVQEAIDRYGIQPLKGEKWKLAVNSTLNPDFAVRYEEENGAVEPICESYSGPASSSRMEEAAYQRASRVVQAFLDDIGLQDYEYPFYYCDDAFRTMVGTVWNPLSEEEFLESGLGLPDDIRQDWQRTKGPAIMVVVRFVVEGLPFGASVSWTGHTFSAGNGNPTPTAIFHVTQDGEICGISIRNPVRLTAQRDNPTELLLWDEVFEMNSAMLLERYTQGENEGNTLTLRHAELVMLTDDKNTAFPAWHLVFEETLGKAYRKKYCLQLSERACISTLGLYFHAYTGKEV